MKAPSVPTSSYLFREIRTLRTICGSAGRDDNGRACACCPVRDLCDAIEERFGRPAADETNLTARLVGAAR